MRAPTKTHVGVRLARCGAWEVLPGKKVAHPLAGRAPSNASTIGCTFAPAMIAGPLRGGATARFFDRREDTQIFKRGMDAHNHPDFYRQLRQDPDQMTADALHLLARKFNLTPR